MIKSKPNKDAWSAYERSRRAAERFYRSIGSIASPAFKGERIHFTFQGLTHFLGHPTKSQRDPHDQFSRQRLLPAAVELIRTATTIQGYRQRTTVNEGAHSGCDEMIRYWVFIAIMNGKTIKTIIRQVGAGKKHFWSVMPKSTAPLGLMQPVDPPTTNKAEDSSPRD